MIDSSKITAAHQRRAPFVYVRQSSTAQVDHNRESTLRQYGLLDRAVQLGWQRPLSPRCTRAFEAGRDGRH